MIQSQNKTRKQLGSVLVLMATGVVSMLGAAALSVDIGFYFVVRNQLQNAVDAATLAGAQGLLADPGDFSSSGQAKTLATQVAAQNYAAGQPVNLSSNEITFPNGNTIRIQITRPAQTFFARVLGVQSVNTQVQAAAVVAPVSGVGGGPGRGGMRPWAILDQFNHGALCVPPDDADINNPPHGPFNDQPHGWKVGNVTYNVNSDKYTSPYDPEFDGWNLSRESDCGSVSGLIAPRDITNRRVYLKEFKLNGNSNPWLTPGNYGAIALGGTGASNYEDNIVNGYSGIIRIGDVVDTETGNMTGPTRSGINQLIAQDPTAHMVKNSGGNWVVLSDNYPVNESPRIVPIPMYGVYYSPANGRSDFKVTSIASFFIEGTDGKDVYGKFVQSRAKNGQAGKPTASSGTQSVGGGGRLVATVKLVIPEQ
ncbi:MAG: hypothetical protein HY314_13275 [Acidobacteria bacterium]|nr:hypothetical protein [Acidobacteriota bacterium]